MTTVPRAYRLFENYALVQDTPFASGGFADIYQARHTVLDTFACLKTNNAKNTNAQSVQLLREEAKLLWALDGYHSLPTVRDYFEPAKHTGVIVMGYYDGKTLAQAVKEKGKLHAEDACWIAQRLLGALGYVHHQGIIHSDVKPENIIVEPHKHDIKLLDFGLAAQKPTSASRALGFTPHYAAPELLKDLPPIPETDMYGVGMTLLYALGGDTAAKRVPPKTHPQLKQFIEDLLDPTPTRRPSWAKGDPIKRLSDIRLEAFGRRHTV